MKVHLKPRTAVRMMNKLGSCASITGGVQSRNKHECSLILHVSMPDDPNGIAAKAAFKQAWEECFIASTKFR